MSSKIPMHTYSLMAILNKQSKDIRRDLYALAEDVKCIDKNGYDILIEAIKTYDKSINHLKETGPSEAAKKDAAIITDMSTLANVPKQLDSKSLEEKPVVHKQFKNYDHSLELDRWSEIQNKLNS